MGFINDLYDKLPLVVSNALEMLPSRIRHDLEEIRLKAGCPILVYAHNQEYTLTMPEGIKIDKKFINDAYNLILNYSVYAYKDSISDGFVTLKGGHRVGICGKTVIENGVPKGITNITSLNIRCASQRVGIAESYYKYITNECGGFFNTILVSPPKCGKTTLLRDFVRCLSGHGFKVGVCDERSEISGSAENGFAFDIGIRTDVLDNCPKAAGMMMLVRSMSPDIIVTDEIGKKEDYRAMEQALVCGVGILTTIHGTGYEDLIRTPVSAFLQKGLFQRIVYLSSSPSVGTVYRISDGRNRTIYGRKESV